MGVLEQKIVRKNTPKKRRRRGPCNSKTRCVLALIFMDLKCSFLFIGDFVLRDRLSPVKTSHENQTDTLRALKVLLQTEVK